MHGELPPDEGLESGPSDDSSIPNNEALLRRLSDSGPNMVAVDIVTGVRRPSSGAFQPDEDGVSVYSEAKLLAAGLGPADLVRGPLNLVVSVEVGDVRTISLGVRDDPWPPDIDEPGHPRNAAHALITGWDDLGRSERRRRQKALTQLPSVRFVFP